jgi:hypothetical protein
MKIIAKVAREENPNVIIMNYGISPLWLPVTDMISLDDQGDLWYELKQGHAEWSIWASLLSQSGVMVSGSSSYNWNDDKEILLNTAIIGVPGASLPIEAANEENMNRRLALNTWYRRPVKWEPAWFNSHTGNYNQPPSINCWGRKEQGELTALALRENASMPDKKNVPGHIAFKGRWALLSQDEHSIYQAKQLAVIPFDAGMISIKSAKPISIKRMNTKGEQPFANYKYSNGMLTVKISERELEQTAGFLITR